MPMTYGTYATPRLDLVGPIVEMEEDNAGENFIAEQVLPVFPVPKKKGTISVITRESMSKIPDTKRAPGAAYNRIGLTGEDFSYACEENGLEAPIDDSEAANYVTDFDYDLFQAAALRRAVRLAYESRAKTILFNTSTFTGATLYKDYSAEPWDDISKDILGHVRYAKKKVRANSGLNPNTMIMGADTMENITANTAIRTAISYTQLPGQKAIENALSALFGIPHIIVGSAIQDTAKEGVAFVGADIWGDDYVQFCILPYGAGVNSLSSPAVGRTFLWKEDSPELYIPEQYRSEVARGDVLRVRHTVDEALIDANFGFLMKVDA